MTADEYQPTDVDPHNDDRPDAADTTDSTLATETATDTVNSLAPAGIDLDAMTSDLDAVDAALARLADGTYWTDEVTGEAIPPAVLEADPIARRG